MTADIGFANRSHLTEFLNTCGNEEQEVLEDWLQSFHVEKIRCVTLERSVAEGVYEVAPTALLLLMARFFLRSPLRLRPYVSGESPLPPKGVVFPLWCGVARGSPMIDNR